jgi:hypothetical protein
MRIGSIALVSALLAATPSFAATQSKATTDDDAPRFETLAWFDASIPNGQSIWGYRFEEAQMAADLSIWHIEQPGCRGFGINEVRVKGTADDAEWTTLTPNVFDGVAHFKAPVEFTEVEMIFSNDRLLRSNCRVLLQKANFFVPQMIELLAKIDAPTCIPDTPDDQDGQGELDTCTYPITRIDQPMRTMLTISEADFGRFNLQIEAFYRLKGYVQEQDDGTPLFILTSATRVM